MTTFFLVKPVDMARASGFMWHDEPNRCGRVTIVVAERNLGDVGLTSAWQGDNAGATADSPLAISLNPEPTIANNEWVKVPVARLRHGASVTAAGVGSAYLPQDRATCVARAVPGRHQRNWFSHVVNRPGELSRKCPKFASKYR